MTHYDPDTVSTEGLPAVPRLTDEALDQLLAYFQQCGDQRKARQGSTMNESDFIAGGMAFLQGLGRWDRLPTAWVSPLWGIEIYDRPDQREASPASGPPPSGSV